MTSAYPPSHNIDLQAGVAPDASTARTLSELTQEMEEATLAETMELEKTADIERPKAERRVRLLVVDDHAVVRKGISAMVSEEGDFEVVGEADSANAAVMLALQLQPDLIVLDIFLGSSHRLDVVQQLLRACPNARIVILTGASDEEQLMRALRVGVHGYLQKSQPLNELLSAMRAIYNGERVVSNAHAMTQVLHEFSRLHKEQDRMRIGLSELEVQLIRLAAEGYSNKEIAARQFWSEVTVKRKMQDIYRKLQATDRAQAVAEAMRMGFI